MSRTPTHLKRLAIQQGNHRIKQRNTSHAVPTDYGAVELTERIALRALFGESTATDAQMQEYWSHLAICRNVLMFGAGHMREQTKRRGGDPQIYIDILDLCDKAKESMLAVKQHHEKTGQVELNGDDRINIAGLVDTSAEFWRGQPAWFFRDCINESEKMHAKLQKEKKAA